jgi:CubicO group peptidase (beta-lactamase class C family)
MNISSRYWGIFAAALACAQLASAEAADASQNGPQNVNVLVERAVRDQHVPGLAVVVLKGHDILAEGAAGVRKFGATNRITVNDQFLLCSGTKAMTATLLAMAVEEGRLSYGSTLGEIFSGRVKGMNSAWTNVTIAQLLEHRGGVPAEHSRLGTLLRIHFGKLSTAEKRESVVEKILSRPPKCAPGTKYIYTALDYIIVGEILGETYGCSWEDLVQDKLWRPLGIASGGFGAPGISKRIDEPWGHSGAFFPGSSIKPDGFWSRLSMPLFFGPGGGAHLTIGDWAKFISLHLEGDPTNPDHHEALLKSESFNRLHQPNGEKDYQAGWYLGTRAWANGNRPGDSGRVFASLGDNGFWHAEAWIAPEINFAIIAVCNQGGTGDKRAARACNEAIARLMKDYLR